MPPPRISGLLEQAKETLDYPGEIDLFAGRSDSEAGGDRHPTDWAETEQYSNVLSRVRGTGAFKAGR